MSDALEKLEEYRQEIDDIDAKLIELLARRFQIVRAVGHLKAENDIAVVQSKRAEAVRQNAMDMAQAQDVNPKIVGDFYTAMIDEAHVIEHAIQDDHAKS